MIVRIGRHYRGSVKLLDVDGIGRVSRIGLGTWQFGSREWGYGDDYAGGAARDILGAERADVAVASKVFPVAT